MHAQIYYSFLKKESERVYKALIPRVAINFDN